MTKVSLQGPAANPNIVFSFKNSANSFMRSLLRDKIEYLFLVRLEINTRARHDSSMK